jgi:hypothetical protein
VNLASTVDPGESRKRASDAEHGLRPDDRLREAAPRNQATCPRWQPLLISGGENSSYAPRFDHQESLGGGPADRTRPVRSAWIQASRNRLLRLVILIQAGPL